MTYNEACALYVQWLAEPGNFFIPFNEWYPEQGIVIEPDKETKRLMKATGIIGVSTKEELLTVAQAEVATAEDGLADMLAAAKAYTRALIAQVTDFLDSTLGVLINLVKGVTNAVANIVSTVQNTINKAAGWIKDTIKAFSDTIKRVVDKIGDWLTDVYKTIQKYIVSAFEKGMTALNTALRFIQNWIADVAIGIKNGIVALAKAITKAFNVTITWIGDKLKAIVEGLKSVLGTSKDWIEGVYNSLGETIKNIVSGIEEGFKTGMDAVILFLKDLWERITAILDKLFDLSIEALTDVFVNVFTAQQVALKKLMERAV